MSPWKVIELDGRGKEELAAALTTEKSTSGPHGQRTCKLAMAPTEDAVEEDRAGWAEERMREEKRGGERTTPWKTIERNSFAVHGAAQSGMVTERESFDNCGMKMSAVEESGKVDEEEVEKRGKVDDEEEDIEKTGGEEVGFLNVAPCGTREDE
ncbi:hypothetical protein CBR_g973 [Chara braunii]|uniref:Uncharacterized protein n=1 Tax=Chara braunii TaxID=69332 RepID=A0A388KCR1_CHABU|nr:hypothetical protein CBR_g973 [Chara braunii]|eukprot:GBG67852.1 hypothetical protein CBR_g973 [Chara braunii]